MAHNIKPSGSQEVRSITDEFSKTPLQLAVESSQIDTVKHLQYNATKSEKEEWISAKTGDCYDLKNTQPTVIVAYTTKYHKYHRKEHQANEAEILLDALTVRGLKPTILQDFTKELLMKALTSSVEKSPSAIMLIISSPVDEPGIVHGAHGPISIYDVMRHIGIPPDTPKVLVLQNIPYHFSDLWWDAPITHNWLIAFSSFPEFAKQLTDATGSEDLYSMLRRAGDEYHGHALLISTMNRRLLLGRSFARTEAYTEQKAFKVALTAASEKHAPDDCYDLKNTQPTVIVAYTTKYHQYHRNEHQAKEAEILLDALTVHGLKPTILQDFTKELLMKALTSSVEKSPSAIMLFISSPFDGYFFTDGENGAMRIHDIMDPLYHLPDTPKVLVFQSMPYRFLDLPWWNTPKTHNWLIACSSFPEFAKQLTEGTGGEDLYDMLRRSSFGDEYGQHAIIISTMNRRLLLGTSFASSEAYTQEKTSEVALIAESEMQAPDVHEPSAVWSELYKIIDFEGLAKAFLCPEDSDGAAGEVKEHPRAPAADKVTTASSIWSSLYSTVDFEELAEAFSGFNTCPGEIQELPRDTGRNSEVSKDDVNNSGQPESSGSNSAPNNNSGCTDQNQEADDDKDKKSALETKNDTAVNSQSKRFFTVGLCNHSTDSMEYDVFFCATNTEGGCANERPGNWMHVSASKSSIWTSIHLTNAVSYVEMVLCMPHYQMVWMNVLNEHFVLINASSTDYAKVKLKSEHIRNVLETLLKSLRMRREVNIIMRYDAKVDFPKSPNEQSQNWDSEQLETIGEEKIWLGYKASGARTSPPDSLKGFIRFEIADSGDPEHCSECGIANTHGKVRASTWNVCGKEKHFRKKRIDMILKTPELINSEVIFLQEFPPDILYEFSCNHEHFSKVFGWRQLEGNKFLYNASLIRGGSKQKTHFKEVRLEDKILKCDAVIDGRNWVTMNCHLKSNVHGTKEENLQIRTRSFDTIQTLAGGAPYILIGGDMNMLDEEASANSLTNITDVWLLAENIRGEYTYTWDPKNLFHGYILEVNERADDDESVPCRFDRFYLRAKSLRIDGYQHLGMEQRLLLPRIGASLHVSDHYGVWTEIRMQ